MDDYVTEGADSLIKTGIVEKATQTRHSMSPSISQPFCKILETLKWFDTEDLETLKKRLVCSKSEVKD